MLLVSSLRWYTPSLYCWSRPKPWRGENKEARTEVANVHLLIYSSLEAEQIFFSNLFFSQPSHRTGAPYQQTASTSSTVGDSTAAIRTYKTHHTGKTRLGL